MAPAHRRALQGRGYGPATIDAVVDYVRTRPGPRSCDELRKAGDGSPQPFYLRYGFARTGTIMWGEDLLSLDLTETRLMPTTLDPHDAKHAAALERLATEKIGWLTTVDPDGQPQASPIWFLWDDGEVLLFSDRGRGATATSRTTRGSPST